MAALLYQIVALRLKGFFRNRNLHTGSLESRIYHVSPQFTHSTCSLNRLIVPVRAVSGTRMPLLIQIIMLKIHVRSQRPVYFNRFFTEHDVHMNITVVFIEGRRFIMHGIGKGMTFTYTGLI